MYLQVDLGGEDGSPMRLLDLADYFCHQPSLHSVSWAPAPVITSGEEPVVSHGDKQYHDLMEQFSSMLLLLHYSRGPLTCLRFNAPHFSLTYPIVNFKTDDTSLYLKNSKSIASDLHNTSQTSFNTTSSSSTSSLSKPLPLSSENEPSHTLANTNNCSTSTAPRSSHFCSISADVLTGEYLSHSQVDEATNLCGSLCWEQDGGVALKCISCVVNYIIRRGNLIPNSKAIAAANAAAEVDQITDPSTLSDPVSRISAEDCLASHVLDVTRDSGTVRQSSGDSIPGGETTVGGACQHRPDVGVWENRVLGVAAVLSSGFLSPNTPLTSDTEEKYGPAVRALARRLFFKLLR